jgi:hypothetical protein
MDSSAKRRGGVVTVLAAMIVVGLVAASSALANGEIKDPCGPASNAPAGLLPAYPEPVLPWVDICSADVAGRTGAGPLRAVRTVLHLDGDVASGLGTGAYQVRLDTPHCYAREWYTVFAGVAGATEVETRLEGSCDYRTTPCPPPRPELPQVSCGKTDDFSVTDSRAISGAVAGKTVTMTLDPNKLPAGEVPANLLDGFRSGHVLSFVCVNTMLHVGTAETHHLFSNWTGMDYAQTTSPVPLGK